MTSGTRRWTPQFQLHHTGIKTKPTICRCCQGVRFQLHHTGIKTRVRATVLRPQRYFNCTIQELKQMDIFDFAKKCCDFNCTIQELKPIIQVLMSIYKIYFNCTIQELKQRI